MQFLSYSSGVMYANDYYPEVIMISAFGEDKRVTINSRQNHSNTHIRMAQWEKKGLFQ